MTEPKDKEGFFICALAPSDKSIKRKRLQQLIREHGNKWKVLDGPHPMQCFNNELGVHVESCDGTHRRNVHFDDIWKSELGGWFFRMDLVKDYGERNEI